MFYYYYSEEFREKIKGYYILLLKSQYAGVYKTMGECMEKANLKKVEGYNTYIIPITTQISYECNDVINNVNKNNIPYNYIERKTFQVNCNMKFNNNIIGNEESYTVDSGNSITHLPMTINWDYKNAKYFNLGKIQKN